MDPLTRITYSSFATSNWDLPAPLKASIYPLLLADQQIRAIWKKIRLYWFHREDLGLIALGEMVTYLFKLNTNEQANVLTKVSSISLLIGARTLCCLREKAQLEAQWATFRRIWTSQEPLPVTVQWSNRAPWPLSRYQWTKLKLDLVVAAKTIQRLAVTLFLLIEEFFVFSMRLRDLVEILRFDKEVVDSALRELPLNCSIITSQLVENKETLLTFIKDNEKTIERVLNTAHLKINFEKLYTVVQSAFEGLTETQRAWGGMKDLVSYTFTKLVYQVAKGINDSGFLPIKVADEIVAKLRPPVFLPKSPVPKKPMKISWTPPADKTQEASFKVGYNVSDPVVERDSTLGDY